MDPISDMLTKIRNAQTSRRETVALSYSKIKFEILKILEREGWISGMEKKGKKNIRAIEISLVYVGKDKLPKISGIKRISKPSKRIYKGYKEIFPVQKGFGSAIYSTPKGILTDKEARKSKVGGELLLEIW